MDKFVRVLIAAVVLVLYLANAVSAIFAIILLIVAIILLLTVFINFCPVWHFPGITTKKKKDIKHQENLN